MSIVVANVSLLAPLSAASEIALSRRGPDFDFEGLVVAVLRRGIFGWGETLLVLASLVDRLGGLVLEFESGLVDLASDDDLLLSLK